MPALSDKSRALVEATLPVVHDTLMWAIADVLGDAVTPDIAAAWDEAYCLMADALTHIERGLYSARAVKPQTIWRQ